MMQAETRRTLKSLMSFCVKRWTSTVTSTDVLSAKPFHQIPGPSGIYNIPGIGVSFHFKPFTHHTVDKLDRFFSELIDKYGSLIRIRLGGWTVLVEDASDIEVVMKSESKTPERKGHLIHELYCENTGARKGLLALQGEEWQKFRSPLNSRMMRTDSAQHYLPVQNDVADDLISRLKSQIFSPEETFELLFKYACESICIATFNKRLGYMDPSTESEPEKLQLLEDIKTMFRLFNQCLYIPPIVLKNFPLNVKEEYTAAVNRISGKAMSLFKETLAEYTCFPEQEKHANTIIVSLMKTHRLSLEDLGTVAVDLLSGGTDPSARVIQMTLYTLAKHPDKQEKLHEEIIKVAGKSGPLTTESLRKMKYLAACVKESTRLYYPVLSGTQRFLPRDIVLQGYKIPAGTSIILMNQKTVKNETHFPNPDSYIPERWLRDEDGLRPSPIPTSALLPFGFGPRQCLGKRFAEQVINLTISKVIQKLKVSVEDWYPDAEIRYDIFVGTKEPIPFRFSERKT